MASHTVLVKIQGKGKKKMSKKSLLFLGLAIAMLMSLVTISSAQEITGNIVGTVRDANGAVVAGATGTIRNAAQNVVVRTITTSDSGEFSAPNVPPSLYTITVEAPNFKRAVQTDVKVDVGQRRNVDI